MQRSIAEPSQRCIAGAAALESMSRRWKSGLLAAGLLVGLPAASALNSSDLVKEAAGPDGAVVTFSTTGKDVRCSPQSGTLFAMGAFADRGPFVDSAIVSYYAMCTLLRSCQWFDNDRTVVFGACGRGSSIFPWACNLTIGAFHVRAAAYLQGAPLWHAPPLTAVATWRRPLLQ